MKITLIAHPSDAPCCVKIVCADGRDMLVQTDFEFPPVASSFGWCTREVQKCDSCGQISFDLHNQIVKFCRHCKKNVGTVCHHCETDGTVNCTHCGVTVSDFIQASRQWIDTHDGARVDDPGYFEAAPTDEAQKRLEYLRGELRAERISYGELAELQSLRSHIKPGDVELQEAAGIPEDEAK